MKKLVANVNRQFHDARIWGQGSFMHVCFESIGCRFRKQGYCLMCDYGAGENVDAHKAVTILESAVNKWPQPVNRLLLGTCGSILDQSEMSRETLTVILKCVSKMNIAHVLLETHYTTINEDVLAFLCEALPQKEIYLEMGFESANSEVLRKSLRKFMDLSQLKKSMALISEYGIHTILNVFLGAPFLSEQQQIDDTYMSIKWALKNGAAEVVIFPANIKPGTEMWEMYRIGNYNRISHKEVIGLLSRLGEQELERVSISWYGDRQNAGIDVDILPPIVPNGFNETFVNFYQDFMSNFSGAYRINLVRQMQEKLEAIS